MAKAPGGIFVAIWLAVGLGPVTDASAGGKAAVSDWKADFAKKVATEVCQKELLGHLEEYFQAHNVAGITTPPSPEALEGTQRNLYLLWKKGFARHKGLVTPEVKASFTNDHLSTLTTLLQEQVLTQCKAKRFDSLERKLSVVVQEILIFEVQGYVPPEPRPLVPTFPQYSIP